MTSVIVCPACDLAHRVRRPAGAARFRCTRCRAELYRTHDVHGDVVLALCASAVVLLALGLAYPLIALRVEDTTRAATLTGAAVVLFQQGYGALAAVVLLTTVLLPLAQVAALAALLLAPRGGPAARGARWVAVLSAVRPWAMSEVFVLGVLVAAVKLAGVADVVPGISVYAYSAFMVIVTALGVLAPPDQLWRWLEHGR